MLHSCPRRRHGLSVTGQEHWPFGENRFSKVWHRPCLESRTAAGTKLFFEGCAAITAVTTCLKYAEEIGLYTDRSQLSTGSPAFWDSKGVSLLFFPQRSALRIH